MLEHGAESRTADVIVIGAGINGCFAAYHLAREGYSVAVLEKGIVAGEASGRNGGGVRQNGRSAAELPLAMHAVRQWEELGQERHRTFEYEQCGNIHVATTPEESEALRGEAQAARAAGLDVQHLTDIRDIRSLVPALRTDVLAANYVAKDGHCQPFLATRMVAEMARHLGARFHTHTAAEQLLTKDGRVTGVATSRGIFTAGAVILAAGPWSVALAHGVGVHLPILVRRTQASVTEPIAPLLTPWLTIGSIWIHQTKRGNLMIGGGGAWEPLSFTKEVSLSSLQRFAHDARRTLAGLEGVRLLRGWGGSLDVTPDFQLIVDRAPGIDGLVIAAGTCGHGFALGPSVGLACAEMATDRRPSVPIDGLALGRFAKDYDFLHHYSRLEEPAL